MNAAPWGHGRAWGCALQGIMSDAQSYTPCPYLARSPREQAPPAAPAPPAGAAWSPGSLLTTWQQSCCLMLPGKRRLVRAQSKMSPKCHSNFRSVHKMADAPFPWHIGFLSEWQHLAPARRPPRHHSALARCAEGRGCHGAGEEMLSQWKRDLSWS